MLFNINLLNDLNTEKAFNNVGAFLQGQLCSKMQRGNGFNGRIIGANKKSFIFKQTLQKAYLCRKIAKRLVVFCRE